MEQQGTKVERSTEHPIIGTEERSTIWDQGLSGKASGRGDGELQKKVTYSGDDPSLDP